VLNTNLMTMMDAQKACNAEGGHLASWTDMDEQGSVEEYFTEQVRVTRPRLASMMMCQPVRGIQTCRGAVAA
jgi:hypothetical protein